jgi:nicotinamide riboside kinase
VKIAFIGAAGSGKTTLATEVYVQLKKAGKNAEMVHEWIRYDIQQHGAMTSIWEQYRTWQHQKELEDAIPAEVEYVIVDGSLLLQYFYAVLYANPAEPRQRLVLQDMYKYLLDDLYLNRYDMIFYLPYINATMAVDGTRYQTDAEVMVLNEHMRLLFTKLHPMPNIHTIEGGFNSRLDAVMNKINSSDCLTLKPITGSIPVSIIGDAT